MSESRTVLIASDLDRTLIYSRAALALTPREQTPLICVETRRGKQASFMTERAGDLLRNLSAIATVTPVTTRTRKQLRRVTLPGCPHRFAIAANGGILLVDGQVDATWSRRVRQRLAEAAPIDEVWAHLGSACRPEWTEKLRNGDNLYCQAVVDPAKLPADFLDQTTTWAAERGWGTSLHGRKLYWVPQTLTKSAAVHEVARRTRASLVLAAGDSLLDAELLQSVDQGIHPQHGELFDMKWSAPHIARTSATGVMAGQEIVEWFSAAAREHRAGVG